jgi:hypothetical protein
MTIIKRADLGRPLTWDELDDNFQQVDNLTAAASAAVSSAAASAVAAAGSATNSLNSANSAASSADDAAASAASAIDALMNSAFEPSGFDFTTGGTLDTTDRNKAVYNPADNNWYSWSGTLPKVVAAGTDPTADSKWIPRTDQLLRQELSSPSGASKVGLSHGGTVQDAIYWLTVEMFGAKGDGVTDDYPAFQRAAMYAESIGGAIIEIPTPAVEYKIGFPVYLFNNTHFKGTGINCRINFTDPLYARKSRSGFVIGSGREQNRDKAIQCLNDGTWSTTGSVVDSTFVELDRGVYLRDNLDKVQSSNCCVSDVYLVASYPNGTTLKGGYGVSFANAIDCEAYNIWGEGWTEIINIGSDVPPATPSCHNCHAYNIVSIEPNNYETYYSIGFIANSTSCSIHDCFQLKPIADDSPHGSGASMNYTEDCSFYNLNIPSLGRTATSEGVLVNNSKGARIFDISIGNAKSGVAEYYTTEAGIFYDAAKPNIFYDIHANNCDHAVALRSKYSVWENVTQSNCTVHVYFGTSNAQYCKVKFRPDSIAYGGSTTPATYLKNNKVEGRRLKRIYFQPLQYLVSDYASVRAGDSPISKAVYTVVDKPLTFIFPIPDDAYAIDDFRMFFRWGDGAQTKGSSVVVSLIAMRTFDGNSSLSPVTLLSTTRTPTSDTASEVALVLQAAATTPGYIPIYGPEVTGYLPRAAQLVIQVLNPVDNIILKECSLQYYGNI